MNIGSYREIVRIGTAIKKPSVFRPLQTENRVTDKLYRARERRKEKN